MKLIMQVRHVLVTATIVLVTATIVPVTAITHAPVTATIAMNNLRVKWSICK
jgi:hypothetical protein